MVPERIQISILCLAIFISVGYARAPMKIVDGEFAELGEFPHLILFYKGNQSWCEGSIINNRTILTVAHCFVDQGMKNADITVLTGTNDKYDARADNVFQVADIIYHEDYNRSSLIHDIAIVKLAQPIPFNANQRPIKLPTRDAPHGAPAVTAGWGTQKVETNDSPRFLQKVGEKVVDLNECNQRFRQLDPNRLPLTPGKMCAEAPSGSGSCFGDSGSSLTYGGELIGITSSGEPCGKGYPDIYTRVYYYLPWIEAVMAS